MKVINKIRNSDVSKKIFKYLYDLTVGENFRETKSDVSEMRLAKGILQRTLMKGL